MKCWNANMLNLRTLNAAVGKLQLQEIYVHGYGHRGKPFDFN